MPSLNLKKSAIVIVICLAILGAVSFFAKVNNDKDTIYVDSSGTEPWELIGGDGERIYLKHGIIYAYKDGPEKEYDIVNFTLHVTSEQYNKLVFFNTPEEAETAGFKPSKDFAEDYECWKAGKDAFECSEDTWATGIGTQ